MMIGDGEKRSGKRLTQGDLLRFKDDEEGAVIGGDRFVNNLDRLRREVFGFCRTNQNVVNLAIGFGRGKGEDRGFRRVLPACLSEDFERFGFR